MKKIVAYLVLILIVASCEKANDCVKSTGTFVSKDYDGLTFSKILVNKGIALVVTQGTEYKVHVTSGENLISDIEVTVTDGMLRLKDNTSCNWTREYGQTTVYVTAPDLTEIYSKTELTITSQGALTFPQLRLFAMDSEDGFDGAATGDFTMEFENTNLSISANNVSRFFLSGNANLLTVNFYEGGGILRAENLRANAVQVYHRGSNDLYVNPINELSGDIFNIGNVISVNHPPVVNVIEHYRGKLIFQ